MHKLISILGYSVNTLIWACLILACLMVIPPKWRQWNGLQARRNEVNLQVQTMKEKIFKLKECQQRFRSDPVFVEQIARESRRVQPGELVFTFDTK